MKKCKKLTALLMAGVMGLSLFGCSSGKDAPTTAAPQAPETQAPETKAPEASATAAPETTGAAEAADVNGDGTVNNPEKIVAGEHELIFWSLFSGGDGDWMDKIIDDYNATNPEYKIVPVKLVWADYYTKLMTAVAAGKGPDIGVSHVSKLPELVANGAVQSFETSLDWSEYTEGARNTVTFDGEVYGVPLDTHCLIAYLNTDLFKEAGIEPDLSVNTEDDFVALLKQLKEKLPEGTYPLAMDKIQDYPFRYWWQVYYSMGGTDVIDADGKVAIDRDKAIKAAEFIKMLFDEEYITPNLTTTEEQDKIFQAGKAAMVFTGTWCVGKFGATDGLNFKATLVPSLFGTESAWADSHVFTIPVNPGRTPEETQGAIDFITWASKNGGLTWAESGQIPSNLTVTQSDAFKALPQRSEYMRAAQIAAYPPQSESFYTARADMIEKLDSYWNGDVSAEDMVDDMIATIRADIE